MYVTYYARYNYGDNLVKIFCNAVERSCGQVEDINIEEIGTDDLLKYIVDNCACHLRCLRLANCARLSERGFIEAVKKLSQLEEIELSHNLQLSNDSLEVVGRCCPLLKSLKYSLLPSDYIGQDVCSFAIAKTMPRLLHLKISGDMPGDDGIQAILDGCHLLESFDLGGCYAYYYSQSLEKRCREQINFFVPPTQDCDSSDYDSYWDVGSINSNWSWYEDCDFDI
ncbi:putative F-box/LRR-repeat protein 23 [Medicago truncatula]|uniref:F-box/LRR protein, putative n=2 Tax=Medicago truncatula TaxID=3880 RepID=A0A072UZP3_MEDTR|nr:putative F-box/LRR-repeat protein 23 [Medicago truncatula]KEH34613.1 F-box/LRR protein, putative [Medicago truncatula]